MSVGLIDQIAAKPTDTRAKGVSESQDDKHKALQEGVRGTAHMSPVTEVSLLTSLPLLVGNRASLRLQPISE